MTMPLESPKELQEGGADRMSELRSSRQSVDISRHRSLGSEQQSYANMRCSSSNNARMARDMILKLLETIIDHH